MMANINGYCTNDLKLGWNEISKGTKVRFMMMLRRRKNGNNAAWIFIVSSET